MKLFIYKIILIVVFASVIKVFAQQLLITQEEIAEIISYLDSTDYRGAINTITEYKISDAREKIEQVFWNSKYKKIDQLNLLRLLNDFDSPFTQAYALAFIDSINNLPTDYSGELPSYLQAMAAGILVQLGDNSKIDLFFEFVDEDSLNSTFSVINTLPVIIEKVPEYEERAKNELIRYVKFSGNDNARYAALMPLYRRYGLEMLSLMLEVFMEDEEANNRQLVLDTLIKCCKSEELHNILKERLLLDNNYYVRYKIIGKLLGVYGTPGDYKFVLDYLPNEPNLKVKEFAQDNLELFEPPKLDSNLTIENLINYTIDQTDTVYSYTWLSDLQFKDKLQNILQSAITNLQNGDSLACVIKVKLFQDSVDYVYEDSLNSDPRFVTLEGWKFLYWNAQYILDRLPEPTANPNLLVTLTNSQGTQIPASNVKYYDTSWKDALDNGDGTFTVITTKPTVSVRMFYEGANQTVNNVPAQNNTYTFQTVNAAVELRNSSGNLIDEGTVQYYAGSWRSFGTTVNGVANKELLPINYSFRMTYEYGSIDKQQDISVNPTVVFQTVNAAVELRNSTGALIDQGTVQYYAGAWRTFGTTVNGVAYKELLPKNYSFRMNYEYVPVDKQQDLSTNSTVTFSTVLCTVKVTNANNQPLENADTKYYSVAWRDIGLTNANGEITKELLPKNLSFRATYGGVTQDKQQDIEINSLVEIQLNVP